MRHKKDLSIRDIAAQAGVSTATVSRVLNKKGGYSAATEQMIMEIIQERNYQLPEKNAEKVIGILIQDITNEWFANVAADLEEQLFVQGYSACIYNTNEDVQKTSWYFDECMRRRFSGIIIVSPTMEIARKARNATTPIIFLDRTPEQKDEIISIEYDHYLGGYMATEHLIRRGCKSIMFLGMEQNNPANSARMRGYLDALKDYQLPILEELMIQLNDNYNLYDTAYQLIYYLLKKKLAFDGIFATNDLRAFGALQALQQNGVKVPEEIKVIGFDDISLARQCYPALTTIRQNTGELARTTVQMMMQLLEDPKSIQEKHLVLPVSLVERGTA